MAYLEEIVDDIATRRFEQIPVEVVAAAKVALVDYVGVTIAGSQHPDVRNVARMIESRPAGGASVLGTGLRSAADQAALHNGFAAHVYDYDDFSIINHPTAPIAPAAFAAAELRHACGADVVRSYVLAGEVMYRIARECLPFTTEQGWHTTGVFGVLGASVAASLSAQLPTDDVAAALGIAASEASGLRGNFGSPVKPFHCGMAARTGVWCAELAHAGLRPTPTILEGVDGFMQLFGRVTPNTVNYKAVTAWNLLDPGVHFKRYACCSSMGPALDALLESKELAAIDPSRIVAIDVGETPWAHRELIYTNPTSATEAKFSMEYAVAAALVYRRADLDIFNDDAAVLNPAITAMMSRVRTHVDDEFARREFNADASVKIEITMADGSTLHLSREFARGNVRGPLTQDELADKYRALVLPVLGPERAESLLHSLWHLEEMKDVSELFAAAQMP